MARRITFSNQHQKIEIIHAHYHVLKKALKEYYYTNKQASLTRFATYTPDELDREYWAHLNELELTSSLSLISAMEAAFRIDFLKRCYQKKKDRLSRVLRDFYKYYDRKVPFEEIILESWKKHSDIPNAFIGTLKTLFKYRHWLAHGRYWVPKTGRQYDYFLIYQIAEKVFHDFPFVR